MFEMTGNIEDKMKFSGLAQMFTYINIDATPGQSGSPVIFFDDTNPHLIGIHTNHLDEIPANVATTIDNDAQSWITQMLPIPSLTIPNTSITSYQSPLTFFKFPTYSQFINTLGEDELSDFDKYLYLKLTENIDLLDELEDELYIGASIKHYQTKIAKDKYEYESPPMF
jgi:hypothetical protein